MFSILFTSKGLLFCYTHDWENFGSRRDGQIRDTWARMGNNLHSLKAFLLASLNCRDAETCYFCQLLHSHEKTNAPLKECAMDGKSLTVRTDVANIMGAPFCREYD